MDSNPAAANSPAHFLACRVLGPGEADPCKENVVVDIPRQPLVFRRQGPHLVPILKAQAEENFNKKWPQLDLDQLVEFLQRCPEQAPARCMGKRSEEMALVHLSHLLPDRRDPRSLPAVKYRMEVPWPANTPLAGP